MTHPKPRAHSLRRRALPATLLALALAACGDKPAPKAPAPPPRAPQPNLSDPVPELPPVVKTVGGVELDALVEAGPLRDKIVEAAERMSREKQASVAALIGAGPAAKKVVIALLGSLNLDEITGALDIIATEGDPTGARADAVGPVLALLTHEARTVRERAWTVAPLVADGERLAGLLGTVPPDDRVGIVRQLASWDGPKVREALIAQVRGADPELALEAALALTSSGRPAAPEAIALTTELLPSEASRGLGLLLARRLPAGALAGHLPTLTAAIDQALLAKDPTLVVAGLRATVALPPTERMPLLEQLAADPRPDVRRAAAEVMGTHGALERALPVLDRLLDDAEGGVRIAAIRARAELVVAMGDAAKRAEAAVEAVRVISPKLSDGHRGVRLGAAAALAREPFASTAVAPLEAQLGREEGPGRDVILHALAGSKARPLVEIVVAKLGDADLQAAAHLALQTATGKDFEAKPAAWRAWLDETFPAPAPEAPKAPAPEAPKAPTP